MADLYVLVDEWLSEEFQRAPVAASDLGLTRYDNTLGDFSAASFEDESRRTARWNALFAEAASPSASLDDRIDLALVRAELAGRSHMEDWPLWRKEPATYLDPCLDGIFSLFLHRLRPEPDLVASAISRLQEVPGVLAAGRANLDPNLVPRLFATRSVQVAKAGASWLRSILPGEINDDRLRPNLAAAANTAAQALTEFADFLSELEIHAKGTWAIGDRRYSALLRDRELLQIDSSELHQRGLAAWNSLNEEMSELAQHIDPEAKDWLPILNRLSRDHPATSEDMLFAYQESCDKARDFLKERELVTMPEGETCTVEPSPPFQRPLIAVASYMNAPPFSASRKGHFFVPYPPAGASQNEITDRLADNGHLAIPSVAVHEAYPGHHWHLTWSARTPRPLRHWITTSYFIEGWALYAENTMREQGYFVDRREQLYQLNMRLFRAARMVVDSALHSGEMTPSQAEDYLRQKVGLTEGVARAEVDRYCTWPTQAASYLTGALEIDRIRKRWSEGPGVGRPLREFHDKIAASPGLPLALAEKAVLG